MASLAQRQYPVVYSSGAECRLNITEEYIDVAGVDLNLELLPALPAADLFRWAQSIMTRAMAKDGEARKSGTVASSEQPIDNRLLEIRWCIQDDKRLAAVDLCHATGSPASNLR
jgi:hypothetical protein